MASMCRTFTSKLRLAEIHEGSCSMHAGTQSVVAKALRTGYYWPTMHKDARALIKACQECQVHKPVPRNPQEKLNSITSPWPFYKWGIDIAGPFPEGPGEIISDNGSIRDNPHSRIGGENYAFKHILLRETSIVQRTGLKEQTGV
ncbi:reverse transcriptase domain-containing protein [Tanacetum coccineum]